MIDDPLALSRETPELSARVPIVWHQKVVIGLLCVLFVAVAAWRPWATARLFVLLSTLFYVAFALYKLLLIRFSVSHHAEMSITPEHLAALADEALPLYSILVPAYKEPESMPYLVKALDELDYPAEKKDVQLLLEADDADTLAAVEKLSLPQGFRVTLIPPSEPRTKPKACNIGLARARGEYLVIYDAEDHPEPDQLKKAVAAFDRLAPYTVCLQSKLNFYNPRQNLLTRWFTAEYCSWFDLALPGLSAVGAVIPLGGTSNHFVTEKLREMLGWDAYNVTEDCDLGVRIYRKGYRSCMLNTTTWEEACSSPRFWIRQRTRWLKGYIQTYFVHMRNPFRLFRDLGPGGFLHFQILIGGVVLSFLINPLYWILAILWFSLRLEALEALFPGMVFAMGALCLFVGNFIFIYTGAVACYRRGYYDLVKHALLTPFYWVLMSVSSWRAFLQFFSKPFYWEKTRHGLFKRNTA